MSHTHTRRRRRRSRFSPDQFAEALDAGGWSLASLAKESGVHASTLSKLMSGHRVMPSAGTYISIIRTLRLSRGDLLEPIPAEEVEP
jgi:transcriptional regulator with XRE-family HTH domain